ncbi:putative feruloyl esterase B [Clostridium sp. D5]|nr:putative feruloyl esterase B [Clostridium sp. D5]
MDAVVRMERKFSRYRKWRIFFRYFLVPGLAHVFGGPGVQDIGMLGLDIFPKDKRHDVLAALAAWVEKGEAPDAIYPVAYKKGLFGRELDYEKKIHPYRGKAL